MLSDRIKEIRAHTGLSAADFGAKIGIKKSSVSLLESGKNNPSERTILAICREFGVNETWLRTGAGSMLDESKPSILARLAEEKQLTPREQAVVSAFLDLSPQDRAAIMRYLDSVIDHLAADSAVASASVTDAQAAGVAAAREYMQLVDSEKEADTGSCISDA